MEAGAGIEPANIGFANPRLTTWPSRLFIIYCLEGLTPARRNVISGLGARCQSNNHSILLVERYLPKGLFTIMEHLLPKGILFKQIILSAYNPLFTIFTPWKE